MPTNPFARRAALLVSLLVSPLLLLCCSAVHAGVKDKAESATHAASGVVKKVEGAVKRGAHAAASGVQRGVKAANHGADIAAKKVGLPPGDAKESQKQTQREAQR